MMRGATPPAMTSSGAIAQAEARAPGRSGAAPRPGLAPAEPGGVAEAAALQRQHLGGFVRWLLALIALYAVVDAAAAAVYRDLSIAVCGSAFALLAAHLGTVWHRIDRIPVARAALEVAGGLVATSTVVVVAFPGAAHGAALMPLAAAAMLLPYQGGPRLWRWMVLAGGAALLFAFLGEVVPSTTRAPGWLVTFYRLNAFAAGLLLLTVLLWQYQARWSRLLAHLREANEQLDERTARLAAGAKERQRVAEALALRDRALDASLAGVAIADAGGRLTYVNPAFLRLWGHPAAEGVLGRPVTEFWTRASEADGVVEALGRSGQWLGEMEARRLDGTTFACQVAATLFRDPETGAVHMTGAFVDVSEQRRAEARHASLQAQLLQAQKMESVGRLAGGVAHDFNNLLTVILSDVGLAQASPAARNPELAESLQEIGQAAERARDLTRQLLALGRRQILEVRDVDLNRLVTDFGKMLARLVGEDVVVTNNLEAAHGLVRADPVQLEQVILNLAVNARDAMPGGGRLTFRTEDAEVGPDAAVEGPGVEPGAYVVLTVSDTGSGMDPETRAHAFEPFFTTKDAGKGTGLGLATVLGIVRQHGGNVWLDSEPGHGTTVRVYLPRASPAGTETVDATRAAARAGSHGDETILLVEDEPAVRAVLRRILSGAGYRIVEADGASAALRQAAEGPFDLLVTDVIMPGLSGRALHEQLAVSRPDMRVLFMSGHAEDAISHHGILLPGLRFLQKPFAPSTLLMKVREALDGPAPAAG
jgi:PAS domain S-box-containing protein